MLNKLALSASLAVFLTACNNSPNPDAGKLTRFVCYQVETPGELSTRNFDFSIVLTQDNLDVHDAANFVPGNKLVGEIGTKGIPFTVRVYKDAGSISSESDHEKYAAALLEQNPDYTYQALGGRTITSYSFFWNYEEGYVVMPAGKPIETVYVSKEVENAEIERKYVWCEKPWGVLVDEGT